MAVRCNARSRVYEFHNGAAVHISGLAGVYGKHGLSHFNP
jgi:hypothetical protein